MPHLSLKPLLLILFCGFGTAAHACSCGGPPVPFCDQVYILNEYGDASRNNVVRAELLVVQEKDLGENVGTVPLYDVVIRETLLGNAAVGDTLTFSGSDGWSCHTGVRTEVGSEAFIVFATAEAGYATDYSDSLSVNPYPVQFLEFCYEGSVPIRDGKVVGFITTPQANSDVPDTLSLNDFRAQIGRCISAEYLPTQTRSLGEPLSQATVTLFPNPARQEVTLEVETPTNLREILAYGTDGVLYRRWESDWGTPPNLRVHLPLDGLPKGSYILLLRLDDGLLRRRLHLQ